jgi:hypothetical protein
MDMAHYCLRAITGLICPSTINKRTKYGKKDSAILAEHPELNAVTALFIGKKSSDEKRTVQTPRLAVGAR